MLDVLESMTACGSSAFVVDIHGVRILCWMIFLTASNAPFGQLKLASFYLLQLL